MQSSPLLSGRKQAVLDASYCHELWASCPKGATAPWETNCPNWAVRAQAQTPCLHPGFLCPPILANWVTFEASICTNFLNVRSLFRRIFYSGESAIELLQSPAGSWKPGCLGEKIASFYGPQCMWHHQGWNFMSFKYPNNSISYIWSVPVYKREKWLKEARFSS